MYIMLLAGFYVTATSKYITLIYLGLSLVTVLKKPYPKPQTDYKYKIVRPDTVH